MKLEVGMYVRTEKGKIDKIIGFDGALILFLYDFVYGYIDENDIVKASHNIIDLIEVGDLVNGEKVIDVMPREKTEDNLIRLTTIESAIYCVRINESEINIKEILTHEQYEANCYKVVK